MKKAFLKKALAVSLSCAMVIALAACGETDNTGAGDAASSAPQESTSAAATQAAAAEATTTAAAATSAAASAASSGSAVSGNYTPEAGAKIELFTCKTEVVGVLNDIIADFEKKYPDVTVTQTAVEDAETVLASRMASNDIPDVMQVYPTDNHYTGYYDAGYLKDLTKEPFLQNVDQSLLDLTEYKGIQFCLPETVSTYGMYYRKDLFEKAGITAAPATYEEFLDDCKKLQASGIDRPIAFQFKDDCNQLTERLLGCIDPNIAESMQQVADGKIKIGDCKGLVTYAKLLSDIKPYATEDCLGMDRDSAVSDIVNGKSAIMFNGSWLLSQFLTGDPNLDIGYCAIPSPLGTKLMVPVNVDTSYAIGSDTQYPQACLAFVDYLSQPEVAEKYYQVDGNINMIKGVSYDKKQLMDVYNLVMQGDSFGTIGNNWPTWDIRADIAAAAQGYMDDEDLDTYLSACQDAIDTYYNQN